MNVEKTSVCGPSSKTLECERGFGWSDLPLLHEVLELKSRSDSSHQ